MAAQPSRNGGGVASNLQRVCGVAVDGLGMAGAVVTMRSAEGSEAIVARAGADLRAVAELEFGLGEGPTRDSWDTRRPRFIADLTTASTTWLGFAPAAVEAGVRAVYAVPLSVGAARFGALTMYSTTPRQLDRVESARALHLAELATELLLDSSARSPNGAIDPHLENALDVRSEIYQAQGMVMVSLSVDLAEALARMRAHAYAADRDLIDVADDILAGRLDVDLHLSDRRPEA